jgi:hypothetical protein
MNRELNMIKTKTSTLIAKCLIFIPFVLLYFIVFKSIFILEQNFIEASIGLSILLILSFIVFKQAIREPNIVFSTGDKIVFCSFPFLFYKNYSTDSIMGYSKTEKTYLNGLTEYKYEMILIYLRNGKKKHLIEYNFSNIKEVRSFLAKNKIESFGKENESYRYGLFRKYKYSFEK